MDKFFELVKCLKQYRTKPNNEETNIFIDLGSASSTVTMFQNVDLSLICGIREYCQGKKALFKTKAGIKFYDKVKIS